MPMMYTEELKDLDAQYSDQMYKLSGPTLLGFPDGCDASRLNMFTQNIKQIICIKHPEFPRVFTGYENKIGELNNAYKKLEGTWEVKDKIYKFGNDGIYTLILYNRLEDKYDIIEKPIVEDLTEKFGYVYNTEVMDSLKIGDTVTDCIIYKSTSYDEDMNYCAGVNALVMYVTDPSTIEDAINIRKGWADSIITTEVDSAIVTVNKNDIFVNLYGDENSHKAFPNIGEQVKDSTICALRRVNYNHALYDMQSQNMQKLYTTDRDFVCSKNAVVYDIDVACNNAEGMPDNIFYHQLKYYYDSLKVYADKINEWCTKIKESGSKRTKNVGFYKDKYQHYNDSDYSWNFKERVFDNLVVRFHVMADTHIQEGYKLVGRYGDKGVVSKLSDGTIPVDKLKNLLSSVVDTENMTEAELTQLLSNINIVEDDEMPYLEDGRYVDITLNSSGAIRRLNTDQIIEVDLNFIFERIRQKLCTMESYDEKIKLIFEALKLLQNGQYDFLYSKYHSFDKYIEVNGRTLHLINDSAKRAFVDEICEKGFYIHKPPYSDMHYNLVKRLYDAFPWIEPYNVYINRFGLRKKIMRKMVVGEKYMYVLKQTTTKNFSARSTGRLNKKNLPEKSSDKKNNRDIYSKTPVRIGEAYNLFSLISPMTLAEYNLFMRSSPIARNSLKRILGAEGNPLEIEELEIKNNYTNTNAVICQNYFKGIGISLRPVLKGQKPDIYNNSITDLHIGGYVIYDRPSFKEDYYKLFKLKDDYLADKVIVESHKGERDEIAWKYVFDLKEAKENPVYDRLKDIVLVDDEHNKDIVDHTEASYDEEDVEDEN